METDSAVAHCPVSNMFIRSGVMPLARYRAEGIRVGLGSDVAGAPELSIITQMREGFYQQNSRHTLDPDGPRPPGPLDWLRLGTLGGAEALGLDADIGSLEVGKEADLIAVDVEAGRPPGAGACGDVGGGRQPPHLPRAPGHGPGRLGAWESAAPRGVATTSIHLMAALLGIDLGTSSVKAVVIDEAGTAPRGRLARDPHGGAGAEPRRAGPGRPGGRTRSWPCVPALHEARVREVDAIGLDGHMHGFALLDAKHRPVGHAITWADQRTASLIPELEAHVGVGTFLSIAGTRPAAGFMAPTMVWLQRHEPARLDAAAVAVMPKDYLRLRLTGEVASDISDASAHGPLRHRGADLVVTSSAPAWACPERLLPPLLESSAVAGRLTRAAADGAGPASRASRSWRAAPTSPPRPSPTGSSTRAAAR